MHVQNAVKVVENLLAKDNDKTQMNHAAPFSVATKLDGLPELHNHMVLAVLATNWKLALCDRT
jgi:hypothetical protein